MEGASEDQTRVHALCPSRTETTSTPPPMGGRQPEPHKLLEADKDLGVRRVSNTRPPPQGAQKMVCPKGKQNIATRLPKLT